MTKIKLNPILSKLSGADLKAVLKNIPDRPADYCFSSNQYAQFFCRKPKTTKKATKKQKTLRDRYKQLECMWKMMTPKQRKLFTTYAREQNEKDRRNLRPIDRFRSKGLKYELNEFIENYLNPNYILTWLKEEDGEHYLMIYLASKIITEFDILPSRIIKP